jgi:glutaredoxin
MYLVIGRENCPYCDKTKELLTSTDLDFVYVDMDSDPVWKDLLVKDMKVKTVPQIFKLVGGYEDLLYE